MQTYLNLKASCPQGRCSSTRNSPKSLFAIEITGIVATESYQCLVYLDKDWQCTIFKFYCPDIDLLNQAYTNLVHNSFTGIDEVMFFIKPGTFYSDSSSYGFDAGFSTSD